MIRAQSWLDVGQPDETGAPRRLHRRDRAALSLALESARVHIHVSRREPYADAVMDELAHHALDVARYALKCASAWGVAGELAAELRYALRRTEARLLRARVALALRVLLRVDRGDWPAGSLRCRGCGWSARAESGLEPATAADRARWQKCPVDPMQWDAPVQAPWEYDLRMRALWESAPPHDGTTPAERRERRAT